MSTTQESGVLGELGGIRDLLTVKRVFGDPYEVDGVMVIPVASVRGGGGGGVGTGAEGESTGSGSGVGYGLSARPLGVYVVRNGTVTWQPAVDEMRLRIGSLVVGGLAILTAGRVLRRMFRRR